MTETIRVDAVIEELEKLRADREAANQAYKNAEPQREILRALRKTGALSATQEERSRALIRRPYTKRKQAATTTTRSSKGSRGKK